MQAKDAESQNPKLDSFRQRKREIQCAMNLAGKLQPFIDLEENDTVSPIELYFYFQCLFCFSGLHCNYLGGIARTVIKSVWQHFSGYYR